MYRQPRQRPLDAMTPNAQAPGGARGVSLAVDHAAQAGERIRVE